MSDLTLPDLVGLVIEHHDWRDPRLGQWPLEAPFRAFFGRLDPGIPDSPPYLTMMLSDAGHTETEAEDRALRLLKQQFPSMRPISITASSARARFLMSEEDYALMRLFFGGKEWT